MIVVAIAGVLLTAARLVYSWRHYQALASMHASKEVGHLRWAEQSVRKQDWTARTASTADRQSAGSWERMTTVAGAMAQDMRRRASHGSRLKQKYERAPRHPWLPVEPDSPEPK